MLLILATIFIPPSPYQEAQNMELTTIKERAGGSWPVSVKRHSGMPIEHCGAIEVPQVSSLAPKTKSLSSMIWISGFWFF